MCSTSQERQLRRPEVGAVSDLQPGPRFPILDERKRYCEGTLGPHAGNLAEVMLMGTATPSPGSSAGGFVLYIWCQEMEGSVAQSCLSCQFVNKSSQIVVLNFVFNASIFS